MTGEFSLRILGDPVLKTPARNVRRFDSLMGDLPASLIPTMKQILAREQGLGISAQQVGSTWRVALVRLGIETKSPEVLVAVNLCVTERSYMMQLSTGEGCLSVQHKGTYFRTSVRRHAWVVIAYQDEHGERHTRRVTGLDAIIAQHEADHLDGKCIADGVSRQQRRQAERIVSHNSKAS